MRVIPLSQVLNEDKADDFSKRLAKLASDSRNVPSSIVILPGTAGELGQDEDTLLEEAYESLAMDTATADQFINQKAEPLVRLLAEGAPIIIQGPLHGIHSLQEAVLGLMPVLKQGACIVVQKVFPAEATAVVTTGAMIHVKAYLGEYDEDSPGDEFLVNKDSLAVEGIGVHEQRVRLDVRNGILSESKTGKKGLEQSITDVQARECARIAKRAAGLVGHDVTCVLGIGDDIRFVYVIDALAVQPIADMIEKPAEPKTIMSKLSDPGMLDTYAVTFLENCLKIITEVLKTTYGTTSDLPDILEAYPDYAHAKDVRRIMKQAGLIKDGMTLDASVLADAYRITQAVLKA